MKLLWKGGTHVIFKLYRRNNFFSFSFSFFLHLKKNVNWWNRGAWEGTGYCIMEGKLKNV
jgi:hypothetical protein